MSHKNRVLNANGDFEPFPERLKEKSIQQGRVEREADKGPPEPVDHSGVQGKKEIAKLNAEIDKAQKELEKAMLKAFEKAQKRK